MKRSHFTREIIELIAITLLLFIVIRFIIHGYHMQSTSMQPEISSDAYIMVNRTSYMFGGPQRGDAVVVHYPPNPNIDVMARIVGLPGDVIKTDSTHLTINGVVLQEPYVQKAFNPEAREWKVPANSYFVLNDNRPMTDDSRSWGTVSSDMVVGKAVIVFWPVNAWKIINNYPSVFSQVKDNH
ncbi:signal peptidase I [Dictyobacter kobayashii]|uniref:Signal peptidase I n=1 Tax=Dictyobacter kobayashii TaxID=2014872 RepID=A0A402AUQ1_9CHLR|nr:signal peptidase I [Dictyobacter kobayashii]GCE22779.1 signal peptidase I [Dictyobacter kobayashii]